MTEHTSLYTKLYNLLSTWLSTEEEDKAFFKNALNTYSHLGKVEYFNDGSTLDGLIVQSGVSCTTDGEWIVITTSTSGEKFVYPPVCFTGSDNWEISFQCKTSSYSNQAFGLQMENCNTTTYSGDSQYTSWGSGKFNNCMANGNITYPLSDNDVVTFRRLNGYWIMLVNGVEKFRRQYTWSNQRVPGFYTNSGRTQRLKNIVVRLL